MTSAGIHVGLVWSLVTLELNAPSSPLMRRIGYIVPCPIAHDIDGHGLRCGGFVGGAYVALLVLQPWELMRILVPLTLACTFAGVLIAVHHAFRPDPE